MSRPTWAGRASARRWSAAKAVEVDGIKFRSKLEARRWSLLRALELGGRIRELRRQPIYHFHVDGEPVWLYNPKTGRRRRAKYTADFAYVDEEDDLEYVEDTKGRDDGEMRLRRALTRCMFGFCVHVVKRHREPVGRDRPRPVDWEALPTTETEK